MAEMDPANSMPAEVREGDRRIHHGPYPEFTWTAVLLGWAIGSLIAVSIGYAALILGFAIEGSELAAILGWGVLRGALRRTSIVENNINQTIASAVNGASSGIMFSVPALFILSRTEGLEEVANFNVPLMILACITGCVLGLAFVIPLRKQMIDFDRLAYPGGIAVATILKSPGAGVQKAMLLLFGTLLSGVAHLLVLAYLGDDHDWHAGTQFGLPAMLNISFYLSVMTIGVGFLVGKRGLLVWSWRLPLLLRVITTAEPICRQRRCRAGDQSPTRCDWNCIARWGSECWWERLSEASQPPSR